MRENPATGEINGLIQPTGAPTPFLCQCGLQYADTPAVRASAGASIISKSPVWAVAFQISPIRTRAAYDRTQSFSFRRRYEVLIAGVS